MSGKFMNVKRIMIPTITLVIIASQLMGCAAASGNELLQMLENGDMIEIEVAAPSTAEAEQGTEKAIIWEQLASLETNDVLRSEWDNILGIIKTETGKNGILYVNAEGTNENNNTLSMALHNRAFVQYLEKEDSVESLAEAAQSQYVDLEADETMKSVYMGINGYFNLLPDADVNYCNPDSTINRLEFMSMVMRAETPVSEIETNSAFAETVGNNDLNIYAQEVADSSYLTLADKSLNNMTANGTITRAEAVYMLMNRYFADELANVDIKAANLSDCKDGGNIAEAQKFIGKDGETKDYWKSYELTYAIANPANGCPTDLYRALVLAEQKGIIDSETNWDAGITKVEAVEMLVLTLQSESSVSIFNYERGTITGYEVEEETTVDENINDIGAGSYQEGDEVIEDPVVEVEQPTVEGTVASLNFSDQDIEYYCNKFNLTRDELLSMKIETFNQMIRDARTGSGNSGNSGGNNSGGGGSNNSGGNKNSGGDNGNTGDGTGAVDLPGFDLGDPGDTLPGTM